MEFKAFLPLLFLSCLLISINCQGLISFPAFPSGYQTFLPSLPPQQQTFAQKPNAPERRIIQQPQQQQPSSREIAEASKVNTLKPSHGIDNNPNGNIENNRKSQQYPIQTQGVNQSRRLTEKISPEYSTQILASNVRPEYSNNHHFVQPQSSFSPNTPTENVYRPPNNGQNYYATNDRKPIYRPPQGNGENGNNYQRPQTSPTPNVPNYNVPSYTGLSSSPNGDYQANRQPSLSQGPNLNFNQRRPINQHAPLSSSEEIQYKPTNYKPITDFAWDLFRNSNSPQTINLVMCPLSPQLLLSYLASACSGETKQQITNAIRYESPRYLNQLTRSMLSDGSNRELQFATAFFVADNVQLNPNAIPNTDAVEVISTDFRNPQKFNGMYNAWASAKTKGQLPNVRFNAEPSTKLIMSSAVYFKGGWIYKFNPAQNGEFYSINGPKSVQMMTLRKKLPYGSVGEGLADWIAIPYNSSDSMVVILPKKRVSLDQAIQSMDKSEINKIMESLTNDNYANVNLTMPKFKIDSSASLVRPLSQMGISKMFQENNEINRLTTANEPIHVSNAVQQASMEVNEEGSIASSLTSFSVVALSYSPPVPEIEFLVNRPFVAMIVDRNRNFPYFVCKVSSP